MPTPDLVAAGGLSKAWQAAGAKGSTAAVPSACRRVRPAGAREPPVTSAAAWLLRSKGRANMLSPRAQAKCKSKPTA
eukprot:scaffold93162_cov69-Phaeocystis_antarctica.AAC.2